MFVSVYVAYNISRSREITSAFNGLIIGIILITNLRFPMLGAFMGEVYILMMVGRLFMLGFIFIFAIMRIVHMKMFYVMRGKFITPIVSPLLVIMIVY